MNQAPVEKKDRNGGGDVTKAEKKETPKIKETTWDLLNNHGEM